MGLFLIERYERSMEDILPQNFYRLMEKLFQKDRPTMEIKILLRAFALGLSQILLVCATAFTAWGLNYVVGVLGALWPV